jgi:hypothetical protein
MVAITRAAYLYIRGCCADSDITELSAGASRNGVPKVTDHKLHPQM